MPPKKKQKVQEWKPLPPNQKHRSDRKNIYLNPNIYPTNNIGGDFPEGFRDEIKKADNRSFWKFALHLYELSLLYRANDDESRADTFLQALFNMCELSNHNYQHKDKYGNYIGIGHDDMGTDMLPEDVKCLRDIHGVGASIIKLIEEWIETGTMKRLEDMREKLTDGAKKEIREALWGKDEDSSDEEEFETKKDYIPDFLNALGDLAELYKKGDDFRATATIRAIVALEGQIITGVDDIEMFKLNELKYVGKSTLEMFKEFIETGKIQRLEDMRPEEKHDYIPDFLEALSELAELYEKEDDNRATAMRRAIIALEGQIITEVEDIKLYVLGDLRGVGKGTIKMLEQFIETGKIQRLEDMRPQIEATTDHAEWFASLTKDQKEYIKTWWDKEGEEKCVQENGVFGSHGIPFTFESEGDTYKVDGDALDLEEEGRCIGVSFEGTIYKNGVEHGTFSMNHEVDMFEREGNYQACTLLNGEEDEALAEQCRDEFEGAYIYPDNMAYRE